MLTIVEKSRKRGRDKIAEAPTEDALTSPPLVWRILESGVLGVEAPVKVEGEGGALRSLWYDPLQDRLVCPHGWGSQMVCSFNADPSKRPTWATCNCPTATGLAPCKASLARLPFFERAAATRPPSYLSVLEMGQKVMLENGLTAWQLPGVYDANGGAVFHARGDSVTVLRCVHGNSTVNLRKDRKEAPLGFQAERAGAVLRALARVRALAPAASATTRRLLLAWVLSFRRAREAAAQAARTRRSVAQRIQCGCKPQFPPRRVQQRRVCAPVERRGAR
jgi:hypothetical protein